MKVTGEIKSYNKSSKAWDEENQKYTGEQAVMGENFITSYLLLNTTLTRELGV